MKRFRIKEVWRVTAWAYVDAETQEEAEKKLEDGGGDLDSESRSAEWEYHKTLGGVEEVF